MEEDIEFNLELQFKDGSIIKLENVKSEEVFQRMKSSCMYFPYSKEWIIQYVENMKKQKVNETTKFLVVDGKFKVKDWFKLLSTRIK
jgi:preprotein translocase subunit SecB